MSNKKKKQNTAESHKPDLLAYPDMQNSINSLTFDVHREENVSQ